MAGREQQVDDFTAALLDGPGAHERISLVTGLRGVGKTVLLNAFEDAARVQSWWVISETATPGFTQRIMDEAFRLTAQLEGGRKRKVSGVNIAPVGGIQLSEDNSYQPGPSLRRALEHFLDLQSQLDDQLGQSPVGLLITLDELHHNRKEEVVEFGAIVQHLVRQDRQIAVSMAGIPQSVKPLLANEAGGNPVTFLRRANRIDLGLIVDSDVRDALSEPLEQLGLRWDEPALDCAVAACSGYPFLIQLVGQESFRRREGDAA